MTGDPTLRLAVAADAASIAALVNDAYAPWVAVIGRKPLPMDVDYVQALQIHRFDLLHRDGRLAALIETDQRDNDLLIENLAVYPQDQGLGLGSLLLLMTEERARLAGLAAVRLYTNQRFTRNLQFYAARGYEIEREEALPFAVAVHMRKSLDTGIS